MCPQELANYRLRNEAYAARERLTAGTQFTCFTLLVQSTNTDANGATGEFTCPWGEIHTYYADGSFEFSRDIESIGWVCYLERNLDRINGGHFWSECKRKLQL